MDAFSVDLHLPPTSAADQQPAATDLHPSSADHHDGDPTAAAPDTIAAKQQPAAIGRPASQRGRLQEVHGAARGHLPGAGEPVWVVAAAVQGKE